MGGVVDAIVDAIESVVDAVVDVIDTVIDVIVDIVEVAVEVVVGLITLVVDVIITVIEAIVDFIAKLLGFDDQVVEQFDVLNQPLFEDPDRSSIKNAIEQAIVKNEDIPANVLYSQVFGGKKNIRSFVKHIDDGNYFEDFPKIEANIMFVDYDDVVAVLNTIEGTPCTISKAFLGTLFVVPWVKYWLQENKGYTLNSNNVVYNGLTYNVDINGTVYNSVTDDYSLSFSNPKFATTVSTTYVGTHHTIDITDTMFMSHELTSDSYEPSTLEHTVQISPSTAIVPTYKVPTKTTGLHYIVTYAKDSDPLENKYFVYKSGSGTYTVLDSPTLDFGDPSSENMGILPAVPLRINNQNFDVAFSSTKADQIRSTVKKLGIDADDTITALMEDVADAGISDYTNKVDHVFLSFGVRVWDTSQIGMNYLFRFCSSLYGNQGVTEAIYNASPASDDKPYNTIVTTSSEYKSAFRFAYITFTHYTLADVDATPGSVINSIYYTDSTKFDSSNNIISTYYVSTGTAKYAVGYLCDNTSDVAQFLAGTLAQESTYVADASDLMQPTVRISYTSTILDSDGSTSSDTVLKPDLAYKNDSGSLLKVLRIGENVTATQEFTYYQCVTNGLNAYTIKAPIGLLRVVDAATGVFKMVKFNIANQGDLMIPFSYDLVKHLPNTHVSSLFLASAHTSIYVAHYEVIEVSFWMKLLAVIIVVIAIYLLYVSWGTSKSTSAWLIKMAIQMVAYYLIKEIILYIAKAISPELAMVIAIALSVYYFDVNSLNGMLQMFGTAADLISSVITQENKYDMEAIGKDSENFAQQYLDLTNPMKDLNESLFRSADGTALALITLDTVASINPVLPEVYYMYNTGKYDILYDQIEAGNMYEQAYDFAVLSA